MAYSSFTLAKVKEDFDLTVDETQNLFADVPGIQPSELLTLNLAESIPLAEEHTVLIDQLEYYIKEVDNILAILLQPIQAYLSTMTGGNEICLKI